MPNNKTPNAPRPPLPRPRRPANGQRYPPNNNQALPRQVRKRAIRNVNKQVKSRYGTEQTLAMTIALPHQATVLRMPTTDAPRTGAVKLRDQLTVSISNSAPPKFNNGDMLAAFYGQPGRLAMIWDDLKGGIYKLRFPSLALSLSTDQYWYWLVGSTGGSVSMSNPMAVDAINHFSSGQTHGAQLPIALSASRTFIFMNTNDVLTFGTSVGASTLVGTVSFSIYRWKAENSPPVHQTTTSATLVFGGLPNNGVLFQASAPGHYAVEMESTNITAGSSSTSLGVIVLLTTSTAPGWQHIHMGELDAIANGDSQLGEDTRVVASSMLMTNTSALLARQGTVLAARLRGIDAFDVTPAALAKSDEKYAGDAAKGVYTFLEFSNEREKFRSCVIAETSMSYSLDIDDYCHFVQITCPQVATASNTFTVSFDNILEFKTDSARYSKSVANLSYGDLILARRCINSNPEWFFENPQHMAALYNWILSHASAAVRGARRYAGPIAGAATAIDPSRAPLYQLLGKMLQE